MEMEEGGKPAGVNPRSIEHATQFPRKQQKIPVERFLFY